MKTRMATKDNKATKRLSKIKKEKNPNVKTVDCVEKQPRKNVGRIISNRTLSGYRKA